MVKKVRRIKATVALVATCVVAITLAACSSANGTSTTSGSGGSSTPAASGSPIRVDEIMTLSGAQGTPFPGLQNGIAARINRLNKAGGIGGRQVQIVNVLDDAGSPTTDLDLIHKAVEQDHVQALFITSNAVTQAGTEYLDAHGIPFFGWAYLPWYCAAKLGFGWAGCSDGAPNTSAVGPATVAAVGKPAAQLRVAVQSADDPASSGSLVGVVQQYKSVGAPVVYTDTSISGTTQTTDYSPYVERLLASKPDLVYTAMNFENVVGFTAALIGSGYKGYVFNGVGYLPGELTPDISQGLNKSYIFNSVPAQEENTPAIRQIEADLAAIGKPTSIDLGVEVGYWSADLFAQMALKLGKNFSDANLAKLANTTGFTSKQIPGGACPVSFPKMHTSAPGGAGVEELVNGHYKVIVKYQCWFEK